MSIIEFSVHCHNFTEIYQGCKHKQFKFLADCKVTWNPWRTPLANYNYIFTFNLLMFHNQSWFCVSNCWWVDDETNLYNYSNIQVMRHLLLSLYMDTPYAFVQIYFFFLVLRVTHPFPQLSKNIIQRPWLNVGFSFKVTWMCSAEQL